jgi:glycine betaine/proline transport system substrate-binding protein
MIKKTLILLLIAALSGGACTEVEPSNKEAHTGELLIEYTDWPESVAMTYLAEVLLEKDLSYDVKLKLSEVDNIFNDIAEAKADVFLDAWKTATHLHYFNEYLGDFEDLGSNYTEAKTGLVVPDYMEISGIEELSSAYSAPVVGIDSTAGIMKSTREAIEAYKLDNELLVLSDAEMSKRLETAYKKREDIVVTGWEPHWLFYRYELKFLNDPKDVFMHKESIHSIARKGFSEEHPHAAEFFRRMKLSEKQMNALLYEMKLATEPLEGVKEWVRKNEFTVNQWTKGLGKERKKIM